MLQKLAQVFKCQCLHIGSKEKEKEKEKQAKKDVIHVTVITPQIQNVKANICMDPYGPAPFSTFRPPPAQAPPPPARHSRPSQRSRPAQTQTLVPYGGSTYSSSSLDDPPPEWTAYCPQNDVAWSPVPAHPYRSNLTKYKSLPSISAGKMSPEYHLQPFASSTSLALPHTTIKNGPFFVYNTGYYTAMPKYELSRTLVIPKTLVDENDKPKVEESDANSNVTCSKCQQELAHHNDKHVQHCSTDMESKTHSKCSDPSHSAIERWLDETDNCVGSLQSDHHHNHHRHRRHKCSHHQIIQYSSESDRCTDTSSEQAASMFRYRGAHHQSGAVPTYDTISAMLDWEMEVSSVTSSDLHSVDSDHRQTSRSRTKDGQRVWTSTATLIDDDESELKEEDINVIADEEDRNELGNFMDMHDLTQVVIPRQDLRTGKLLLKGINYSVCSGCMKPPMASYAAYVKPVCIQIFREVNSDQDQINFLRNVMSLRQLRHTHVLEVLGVCLEGSPVTRAGHEVLMVTGRTHSAVTLHSLLQWCRSNNPQALTPHCILTFSTQMLQGLQYLENQGIMHTNLTTSTVMLSPDCSIKLSGLEPHVISMRTLAYRWIAIECHRGKHSHKSTVWSFGVVLWAMTAYAAKPYGEMRKLEVFPYLCKGKRLARPPHCPRSLYLVAHECWHARPHLRPSIGRLLSLLEDYHSRLPVSPSPAQLFPDREEFWNIMRDHTRV